MEPDQIDLLPDDLIQSITKRRKELIPLWIKIFAGIFLIIGLIAPVGLLFGILGYNFHLSVYGFETNEPLSLIGIGIIILFTLKGTVSFGILKEKNWAITLGLTDAIVGILLCCFATLYPLLSPASGGHIIMFRLELIALIPYLLKLRQIKSGWKSNLQP